MYAFAGIPSLGVFYGSYNELKAQLSKPIGGVELPAPAVYCISAVIADTVALPLFAPVEMIAKRMQVQSDVNPHYRTVRGTYDAMVVFLSLSLSYELFRVTSGFGS